MSGAVPAAKRKPNKRGNAVGGAAVAAACVACCATPIMAVAGSLGFASVGLGAVFGVFGLLIGVVITTAVVLRRRRASLCRPLDAVEPVAVTLRETKHR